MRFVGRMWWWTVVVLQFIFFWFTLYRRFWIYGRGIPAKVERKSDRGDVATRCPMWESGGRASEYCFSLFLIHASVALAALFLLPAEQLSDFGIFAAVLLAVTNYCGYFYERRRIRITNQEIVQAEQTMSDAILAMQKSGPVI